MQLKEEVTHLNVAKEAIEREIEAHQLPIEVAMECLTLRERRRDGDLVRDKLEVSSSLVLRVRHRTEECDPVFVSNRGSSVTA